MHSALSISFPESILDFQMFLTFLLVNQDTKLIVFTFLIDHNKHFGENSSLLYFSLSLLQLVLLLRFQFWQNRHMLEQRLALHFIICNVKN